MCLRCGKLTLLSAVWIWWRPCPLLHQQCWFSTDGRAGCRFCFAGIFKLASRIGPDPVHAATAAAAKRADTKMTLQKACSTSMQLLSVGQDPCSRVQRMSGQSVSHNSYHTLHRGHAIIMSPLKNKRGGGCIVDFGPLFQTVLDVFADKSTCTVHQGSAGAGHLQLLLP